MTDTRPNIQELARRVADEAENLAEWEVEMEDATRQQNAAARGRDDSRLKLKEAREALDKALDGE